MKSAPTVREAMRQQLSLKPAHKVVQEFYKEIENLSQLNLFHEGAVSPAFANLRVEI